MFSDLWKNAKPVKADGLKQKIKVDVKQELDKLEKPRAASSQKETEKGGKE